MVDPVRLSRVQFATVAVESTILMFVFEQPSLEMIRLAFPAILYAGIFSSGVAYTMQIVGQEDVNPTLASLVMSLESVFGAISGWIVLGERMLPVEMAGAALMFAAVILAQVPLPEKQAGQARKSQTG
jgi:drug/metabolite transporter (DMT)-like permease